MLARWKPELLGFAATTPHFSSKQWRHVFVCLADALAYFCWWALAHLPVPQSTSAHVDLGLSLSPQLFFLSICFSFRFVEVSVLCECGSASKFLLKRCSFFICTFSYTTSPHAFYKEYSKKTSQDSHLSWGRLFITDRHHIEPLTGRERERDSLGTGQQQVRLRFPPGEWKAAAKQSRLGSYTYWCRDTDVLCIQGRVTHVKVVWRRALNKHQQHIALNTFGRQVDMLPEKRGERHFCMPCSWW